MITFKKATLKERRQRKIISVMREFKGGGLRSSTGKPIANRKQAIAIALSEAKRRIKPQKSKFSINGGVVEFAKKRKKLSRLHRQKISQALKGRKRASVKDRRLTLREKEVQARQLRNVGYITNAITEGVREARQTARYLGFGPRNQKKSGLAKVTGAIGRAGETAKSVTLIRRALGL